MQGRVLLVVGGRFGVKAFAGIGMSLRKCIVKGSEIARYRTEATCSISLIHASSWLKWILPHSWVDIEDLLPKY